MLKANKNLTASVIVFFFFYLFGILDRCNAPSMYVRVHITCHVNVVASVMCGHLASCSAECGHLAAVSLIVTTTSAHPIITGALVYSIVEP